MQTIVGQNSPKSMLATDTAKFSIAVGYSILLLLAHLHFPCVVSGHAIIYFWHTEWYGSVGIVHAASSR